MHGYFSTSDGARLYYEDTHGPHDGSDLPCLVFIYGLACSISHWKYPIGHFAKPLGEHNGLSVGALKTLGAKEKRRIVWFDLRQHGKSVGGDLRKLSLSRLVQDIVDVCVYLKVSNATFCGQSMGGIIALELGSFAAKEKGPKDLVKALILLASPARDPSLAFPAPKFTRPLWNALIDANRIAPQMFRAVGPTLAKLEERPGSLVLVDEFVRVFGFNTKLADRLDIQEYVRKVLQVSPDVFFYMAKLVTDFDIKKLKVKPKAPSLVIAGAQDKVVPVKETKYLLKHLPHAELALLQHGSHCPHFDDPGWVCRKMEAFLEKVGS